MEVLEVSVSADGTPGAANDELEVGVVVFVAVREGPTLGGVVVFHWGTL